MRLNLFTDGGARGNPGPGAIGIVLKNSKNTVIKETAKFIGESTNNEAEYEALIEGLEQALEKKATRLVCHLDSQLIVKQLNGEFKVKDPRMKKYWNLVKNYEKLFESVEYKQVPREKNFEADTLVNNVLNSLNQKPKQKSIL